MSIPKSKTTPKTSLAVATKGRKIQKEPNPYWIRFMATVSPQSVTTLFKTIDQAINDKHDHIHLMLSSPGGSVFHGLSAHNYLRGLGIPITTYNFGLVDSIGVILFCSGEERVCVPHARFLIHQVTTQFQAGTSLDEKGIEEVGKGIKIDTQNIARVISDCTGKNLDDVEKAMSDRTTLNPMQAKEYGLVTKIQKDMYKGGRLSAIYEDGTLQTYTQLPMSSTQIEIHYTSIPMTTTFIPGYKF
jgi:ATP-dependent Clp protease protease subunit